MLMKAIITISVASGARNTVAPDTRKPASFAAASRRVARSIPTFITPLGESSCVLPAACPAAWKPWTIRGTHSGNWLRKT